MPREISNPVAWQPVPIPQPVTLNGRYVTLEPLSAAKHADALWESVQGHDEVWTWLADGPYASRGELAAALAVKEAEASARFFAIVPKNGNRAAGYASYMRMDAANGVIEVGNVMFSPRLQRTAAATEAMYRMGTHVFEELGYRRYEWKCNALNLPSQQAAKRLGFTFEGVFRQHMIVKGENRDTAWYSMLDWEWPERKQAFAAWLAPENFDAEGGQRRALHQFRKVE